MLKTLWIAWKEARRIRDYIAIADKDEFWKPIDGAATVKFFSSYSGKKLYARLSNMVYKSAIRACGPQDDGDYQRGIAHGILITVQTLDQHINSGIKLEPKDFSESDGENTDTSGVEQLAMR